MPVTATDTVWRSTSRDLRRGRLALDRDDEAAGAGVAAVDRVGAAGEGVQEGVDRDRQRCRAGGVGGAAGEVVDIAPGEDLGRAGDALGHVDPLPGPDPGDRDRHQVAVDQIGRPVGGGLQPGLLGARGRRRGQHARRGRDRGEQRGRPPGTLPPCHVPPKSCPAARRRDSTQMTPGPPETFPVTSIR
jgi:hypothetical protein